MIKKRKKITPSYTTKDGKPKGKITRIRNALGLNTRQFCEFMGLDLNIYKKLVQYSYNTNHIEHWITIDTRLKEISNACMLMRQVIKKNVDYAKEFQMLKDKDTTNEERRNLRYIKKFDRKI